MAGVASKLLLDVKRWGHSSDLAFWDVCLGSVLLRKKGDVFLSQDSLD
jgi:hypothetical protein